MLAILNSVEHFRPYLFGRKFIIYTDHRPLQWLFNCKNPTSKLVRWRLRLNEFEYEIRYKPGRINSNADGLSRLALDKQVMINSITNALTYQDFIKFHYMNQDVIVFEKENGPLSKVSDPIVIMWSQDLDESNEYSDYICSYFDVTNLKPSINGAVKLQNKNQIVYLTFPQNLHFDRLEYKNIFESLINLRKIIKDDKFVLVLPSKHTNIKIQQLSEMIKFIFPSKNISILNTMRIIPKDQEEVTKILQEYHDSKLAGHFGFHKTYTRIKESYYWPHMKADIRKYVKSCHSCQLNKTNFKPTKQAMEITSTAEIPFERIAIDIVGPLPLTESGNKFILTLQDDLTRFCLAEPIPNHEALTVAKVLTKFFVQFGIPKTFLTDQGADFMSELMKNLSNLFKTKHLSTTPYHPQTNGALERYHLTLKDYLKHYIKPNQTDWDEYIQFAIFSYNTSVQKSTSYTPHELFFGRKPYLPSSITKEPEFRYTYDDYLQSLIYRMNTSFKIARENLITSKFKSKQYYDKKINHTEFHIGDLVCLYQNQTKPGLSKKLLPNFKGPFKITRVFSNGTVEIKIGNKLRKYHTNILKHYVSDESVNLAIPSISHSDN